MNDWRDFSTAPRDGTVIFGLWWHDDEEWEAHSIRAYTGGLLAGEPWEFTGGYMIRYLDPDNLPALWMPAPDPNRRDK